MKTPKFVLTKGRVRALKATLLATSTHRYPYSDVNEMGALKDAGLLDNQARITVAGALVVLRYVAAIQVPWLALDETRRVVEEMTKLFGEELNLPK